MVLIDTLLGEVMKKITSVLIAAASLLASAPATAAVYFVEYTGVITETFAGFPGDVPGGVTVSGSFLYEEPSPAPSGNNFSFTPITFDVSVNGIALAQDDAFGLNVLDNLPNSAGGLRDRYSGFRQTASEQFLTSGIQLIAAGFSFELDGTVSNPPTLTTSLIPPTDAAFLLSLNLPRTVFVTFKNLQMGDGNFGVAGQITGLTISEVPLPAALPLMLMGLAGLGAVKRRQFSKKP